MNTLEIAVAGDEAGFEPGAPVAVEVEWDVPEDYERLELCVLWTTHGKGTTDAEVHHTVAHARPARAGKQRFELELPRFPWSFSGRLVTLQWAVEALLEPKGPSARQEIVVAPGAIELRL